MPRISEIAEIAACLAAVAAALLTATPVHAVLAAGLAAFAIMACADRIACDRWIAGGPKRPGASRWPLARHAPQIAALVCVPWNLAGGSVALGLMLIAAVAAEMVRHVLVDSPLLLRVEDFIRSGGEPQPDDRRPA